MILEFVFFHTYPALLSLLGATMIIVSAVYVAVSSFVLLLLSLRQNEGTNSHGLFPS